MLQVEPKGFAQRVNVAAKRTRWVIGLPRVGPGNDGAGAADDCGGGDGRRSSGVPSVWGGLGVKTQSTERDGHHDS